jgi:hypothetical protein
MAHIRLYDAALSALEIGRDMAQDEAALAAFVRTHPLDFNLFNEDQHHVLYIDDDPAGQTMTLDLTNTSRQDVVLKDIGQQASDKAYHFQLRFRAETLAQTPAPQLATDGWIFSRAPDNTAFYLLHKGELKIPSGQATRLTLRGMNADGRGGTRGSRVELLYQRMQFAGETAELNGSRLQYLDVVNHRGMREIPLHVGFVGGNTVLSDGSTPSPLRLRIANTSRDAKIKLNAAKGATPASTIVVSFDVQEANETREWALIGAANANTAQLRVTEMRKANGKWADPVKRNLGQSIEWTLTPSADVELGPDGSLLLALDNIIALASLGHANIYIAYKNVPGYQDGLFVVGVEKSPLLFWQPNVTDKPSVGVGITPPTQSLDVNGNIRQRGFDLYVGLGDGGRGDTGHSRALVKDWGSRLTINYASDYKGGVTINGPQISLNGNVTVGASTEHLQLRRAASERAGGNVLFLELYQDTAPAIETYPSIRFHQGNKFWHRIEGRPQGIMFKDGNLGSDSLIDIFANTGAFNGLRLGSGYRSSAFNGGLRAGQVQKHTILTLPSHRSAYVDLLIMAHDMNSNTYRYYLKAHYAVWREWDRAPQQKTLSTIFQDIPGNNFSGGLVIEGNDVKAQISQGGFDTVVQYTIVANHIFMA